MDSVATARLLPGVFQTAPDPPAGSGAGADTRLAATLGAMETLHAPVESVLGELHRHLDPRLAPPPFVPYLAGWVDLDWLFIASPSESAASASPLASGLGHLRELVA